MKLVITFFAAALLSANFVASEECGDGAVFETSHNSCTFRCTPDGVVFDCSKKSCKCSDYSLYYNLDTKSCSEVNCDNMNCAGHDNEYFFTGCESGSRDRCGCGRMMTMDCSRGCMCKNGFCRKEGKCVPRDCKHPFYS